MSQPTSATQAKDRLYAQLAASFGRMSRAVSKTTDLCEQWQEELQSMRTLAALDAAKFMTVAVQLNPPEEDDSEDRDSSKDKSVEEPPRSKQASSGS